MSNPPPQFRWAYAAACASVAMTMAQRGLAEPAMQMLSVVPNALVRGAPWGISYGIAAHDTVFTLWLLNRTDHLEVIEKCLRDKVLAPDFRFPMRDARLSMARLCALQGRHAEAAEWFTAAQQTLEEPGWRPLRAIVDYDEGLMYLRRDMPGDRDRARPFLQAAGEQFDALGMTGWSRQLLSAESADGTISQNREPHRLADSETVHRVQNS